MRFLLIKLVGKNRKRVIQLFDDASMYKEDLKVLSAVGGSARAALMVYRDFYGLDESVRTMKAVDFDLMLKEIIKKR